MRKNWEIVFEIERFDEFMSVCVTEREREREREREMKLKMNTLSFFAMNKTKQEQ